MVHILLGLVVIAVGTAMVIKSEAFLSAFGRIGFFEEHLGSDGGSRLGYKLIGMLVIFIGVLILTNMIWGFLEWLLSPLLRYSK